MIRILSIHLSQTTALVLLSLTTLLSSSNVPAHCVSWGAAQQIGFLNPEYLQEASGLDFGRYSRLYHNNDSGHAAALYVTSRDAGVTQEILINEFEPEDVEDLTYGNCFDGQQCIILGDIGISRGKRDTVRKLVVIQEQRDFSRNVTPERIIPIRYPDGLEVDAESLALHPNGDLFLITKNYQFKPRKAFGAAIYRIPKAAWQGATVPKEPVQMEFVTDLDLREIYHSNQDLEWKEWLYQVPTGFDISADGRRFLVLNYITALEFHFDLSRGELPSLNEMTPGRDYSAIKLEVQPTQEAIAYLPEDDGFVYSSEVNVKLVPNKPVGELLRVRCSKKTQQFASSSDNGELKWASARGGQVPSVAVEAGLEHSPGKQKLYICRAQFKGGLHPGKVRPGFRGCNIGWGGKEHAINKYEVLIR